MLTVARESSFVTQKLEEESAWSDAHDYVSFHKRRFEFVASLCRTLRPDVSVNVLDVGRSYLSWKLAETYARVSTIGFPLESLGFSGKKLDYHGKPPSKHIIFDLNNLGRETIPTSERFDLIVFAETIEHLTIPAELALYGLAEILSERGIIVCQTPNSCCLANRLKMLAGRNPFEKLRYTRTNPGHFREYTKQELQNAGSIAGLKTIRHIYGDYFGYQPGIKGQIVGRVTAWVGLLVSSLRRGQTIIYIRDSALS